MCIFASKKLGQCAKQIPQKLFYGNRLTLRAPKRSRNHMLNLAFFAIRKFYFHFFRAYTGSLTALGTNFGRRFFTGTRSLAAYRAHAGRFLFAYAGELAAFGTNFGNRLAVPFRVGKMMVGIDKIVDGEIFGLGRRSNQLIVMVGTFSVVRMVTLIFWAAWVPVTRQAVPSRVTVRVP